MAKNKKDKSLIDVTNANKETIFGTDSEYENENRREMEEISSALSQAKKELNKFTGPGMMDFLNSSGYQKNQIDKGKKTKQKHESKDKFKRIVTENEQGLADSLLSSESGRILLYDNYDILVSYIPKLGKAIEAISDAILSPDNLTDNLLKFKYDGMTSDSLDADKGKTVFNNIDLIKEKFNYDNLAYRAIHSSLIYGDTFYLKLAMNKEFNEILTEDSNFNLEAVEDYTVELSDHEERLITEGFNEYLQEENIVANSIERNINWEDVMNSLMENIEFGVGADEIVKDKEVISESFKYGMNEFTRNSKITRRTQSLMGDILKDANGEKKDLNVNVGGTVLRELDRKRVVKIYLDGITYGYFYFLDGNPNVPNDTNTTSGMFRHAYGYMQKSSSNSLRNETNHSLKKNAVMKMFTSKVADKLNSKFLKDNPHFRDIIYNLASMDYFTKKKVKVIFLNPEEVEHFYPKLGDDGYGVSVLKDALFLGTIYIATMITTLMQKLIRSPQKRVFSIDVGLDEDYSQAVHEFVKSIKTSDVKFNGKDINSVLSQIGMFQDIYIPTVDGETPIQIDTLDGLDSDTNDDFLEYLLKEIVDSIGIPSSFLESASEIDFAREISAQNSLFVRRIITLQRVYTVSLTNLMRTLYKNEFKSDERDKDDAREYDSIEVILPKPVTLMLSTITDTISSVKDTIDFVSETYLGDNNSEDTEKLKTSFKKNLARHYFPIIDWAEMDDIFELSRDETTEEEIRNPKKEGDEGGGGGYF